MAFLTQRKTLGFKIEDVPYTAETLALGDFDVGAYAIEYDPETAAYIRKLARGDFTRDPSVMGKRKVTIKFSVDVQWSGNVIVAPTYWKCLRACAWKQTTHGATGVSIRPHSDYSNVPATIEVVEKNEGPTPVQLVIKGRGCMGEVELIVDTIGNPVKINFEFTGALNDIYDRAYASILNPTNFNIPRPDAVLSASIMVFTESQKLDKFSIKSGNVVELFSDPSKGEGWEGAHIVDQNPTMEWDPDMDLIANRGNWARWTGATLGAMEIDIGDNIQILAPAVQLIKAYTPAEREGHTTDSMTLEFKRSIGNDALEMVQGSK